MSTHASALRPIVSGVWRLGWSSGYFYQHAQGTVDGCTNAKIECTGTYSESIIECTDTLHASLPAALCFMSCRSRSGVPGTVVLFSPGDAEAGVVFDGEVVENCEKVLARDLKAAGVGFRADPDTPAQPVVAQLLALLGALLHSDEVSQALRVTVSEGLASDDRAVIWLRMLSLSLMAVLQLSMHCGDAVVAACQEGDVVAHVLPRLREVAVCPIQLPALLAEQVRSYFC